MIEMRCVAGVAAILGLVACGESREAPGQGAEVTDSAGVRIVTSPASDMVYAGLAEAPSLSIGAVDGPDEFLFSGVMSVARDVADNLVIADAGSSEIRIFDAAGVHLRTLGGQGDGPGEFRYLSGAWPVAGGGIVAQDFDLRRVTEFDPVGSVIGTGTVAVGGDMGMLQAAGLAGPRTVLGKIVAFSLRAPDGEVRPPVFFVRYGLDGAIVDTVASLPGQASVRTTSDGGISFLRVPFSPEPAAAGSAAGVAVTGGEVYEVRFFNDAESLSHIARLAEAPATLTDQHLEDFVRRTGRGNPGPEAVSQALEMYRDLPLPATLPAYARVLFADTGELWAERSRVPGTSMLRWDVFGTDGDHLGGVGVPASFWLHEVSRNQLLGVARDDMGVERVRVWELTFN